MSSITENIAKLEERLTRATEKYGRQGEEIKLLAVSKTRSTADIRQAHQAGLSYYGENYLNEAKDKISSLSDLKLEWHFIGSLQSNKTRQVASDFQWVQSVDRQRIARRLSESRPINLPALNVCIQVNINQERNKAGVLPESLPALAESISQLSQLRLRGLMAIPEASQDEHTQRENFARMRRLYQQLQADYPDLDTLSMGMSNDLEAAIAEGSTMIRIGTAIFGPRASR